MSIKYYHLAKDEELPEEFCAIRDEGGEPNGYVFYVPESEVAKLRELLSDYQTCTNRSCPECRYYDECFDGNHITCCIAIDILDKRAQEFGIGVRDELGTQVQP